VVSGGWAGARTVAASQASRGYRQFLDVNPGGEDTRGKKCESKGWRIASYRYFGLPIFPAFSPSPSPLLPLLTPRSIRSLPPPSLRPLSTFLSPLALGPPSLLLPGVTVQPRTSLGIPVFFLPRFTFLCTPPPQISPHRFSLPFTTVLSGPLSECLSFRFSSCPQAPTIIYPYGPLHPR